ncbi:spore coat protein [Alteribacter keqinensis]|uniref:Spore coat protein n=1 Tax=Alteribacter keqinensis TaxID=2483800 RepID=A0A3M7TX93_9BACI|nr:spore coat protein [Alteribacter keqinensis]RNA70196.1 spore coat protein [Alteribacter keqinensis]
MENKQTSQKVSEEMPPPFSHGGHELFDVHEVLSAVVALLDQYKLYENQIKDTALTDILNRQSQYMTQLYNTMLEAFQTGEKPSTSTQVYKMTESNNVIYGLSLGKPVSPIQSASDVTDQSLSSYMLGQTKSLASLMAMTALEMTNPVIRRIIADSVPNVIEMSYEIFLYQNKHGYYQVPQLKNEDMRGLLEAYSPVNKKPLN